ncbi:family 2 glycosyl transferase [Nitzschia inconspicua]|uniref:Family 2 glycosyl transferase n=1 Tax=Nitzschia inconspicua TaxID=303405 RepID=A0A9K3KZE8_9STRA|nr:family 2 glycosyl transferase [Nitzschia inconspicua]
MASVSDAIRPPPPLSSSSSSSSFVIIEHDDVKDISRIKTPSPMKDSDSSVERKGSDNAETAQSDSTKINKNDESCHHDVEDRSRRSPVRIGGPGSRLPRMVESFLSWVLALSCLSVACWYYFVVGKAKTKRKGNQKKIENNDSLSSMPLMTHCPRELLSVATVEGLMERYQQLQSLIVRANLGKDHHSNDLLTFLRNNHSARRLSSLIMIQRHRRCELWHEFSTQLNAKHIKSDAKDSIPLLTTLISVWPELVSLPKEEMTGVDTSNLDISVIVPLYKENGRGFLTILMGWINTADDPTMIEFIIVDAGGCTHMTEVKAMLQPNNNNHIQHNLQDVIVNILDFKEGGGRGPCLNYGARYAQGRFFTFLHGDTRLSPHWDTVIRTALGTSSDGTVKTFCAFAFAIDRSPTASHNVIKERYDPPGLSAIETTANWRCRLFQLPYGDQGLSIPRYIFEYLGGYPDQCLMEDYELVQLLRQRCRVSSRANSGMAVEQFQILPLRAYCSPRRWQSFGVLYVTFTNSRIVQLYNMAINNDSEERTVEEAVNTKICSPMSADEALFCRYYGTGKPPPRKHLRHSPWEVELLEMHFHSKKQS